jgi:hypothetical protein
MTQKAPDVKEVNVCPTLACDHLLHGVRSAFEDEVGETMLHLTENNAREAGGKNALSTNTDQHKYAG